MPPLSKLRLSLTASLCVTLAACAGAPARSIPTEPIVTERIVTVTACAPEVQAELPDAPRVPEGAVLRGNEAGQAWLSALIDYAGGLRDRLTGAREACRAK
jgi:hypothetical protein